MTTSGQRSDVDACKPYRRYVIYYLRGGNGRIVGAALQNEKAFELLLLPDLLDRATCDNIIHANQCGHVYSHIDGISVNFTSSSMEAVVLENKAMLEIMAKGQFSGRVNHDLRKQLERVLTKHSPGQMVEWNCGCNSVQRMAKIILAHEK